MGKLEKWDDLKPDIQFLKNKLSTYRLLIERQGQQRATRFDGYLVDTDDIQKRMEFEFILLQFQSQERLIETLEKSIKAQDKFSKSANLVAIAAIIIAAVQVFIALYKP